MCDLSASGLLTERKEARCLSRRLNTLVVIFVGAWLFGTMCLYSFFPETSLIFFDSGSPVICYRSSGTAAENQSKLSSPRLHEVLDALPFECKSGRRIGLAEAVDALLVKLGDLQLKEESSLGDAKDGPLVTVIVPFFDSVESLNASVYSIIGQTYKTLEILLIDQGFDPQCSQLAMNLAKLDNRIHVKECPFTSDRDSGGFLSKNFGVVVSEGSYVTFQDPDAISHPDRIASQVQHLELHKNVMFAATTFLTVNSNFLVLENDADAPCMSTRSAMIRRRVFSDIGYFDSVRYLADEEFYVRLKKYYEQSENDVVISHDAKSGVSMPLYYAVRDHALPVPGKCGTLTQPQQDYVDSFVNWHAATKKEKLFIGFPQRTRPFAAPISHQVATPFLSQVVVGTMATCRRRKVTLLKALDTLVHQFDFLYVYLNDFKESELPEKARHSNVIFLEAPAGDIKDNGKIYSLDVAIDDHPIPKETLQDAYIFTLDDDILYPADYVQRMILKIESQHRKAVFGVHCVRLQKSQTHYYDDGRVNTPFWYGFKEDETVHVLGSGTTAWHYKTFQDISVASFPELGMVDIWLAALASENHVTLTCVSRPNAWLKRLENKESIYDEFHDNKSSDATQTRVLRRIYPGFIENWKENGKS